MSYEESLERVLDPDGLYWRYPGDEQDDPQRARLVEVRLDVRSELAETARSIMEKDGWALDSQADEETDPIQRLYFRKAINLQAQSKIQMLTVSLQAAHAAEGKFWSWINGEDVGEN